MKSVTSNQYGWDRDNSLFRREPVNYSNGAFPLAVLKRAFRKVRYAIMLLKVAGLGVFFHQLKRQLYSRATLAGLEKDLDSDIVRVPTEVGYSLRLATEEDMEEVFQKIYTEGKESVCELIQRKMFYDAGFHNCYVARTIDTNELCHMKWLTSSKEEAVVSRGYRRLWHQLKDDELLVDNTYTFDKYRGSRISSSIAADLFEMARRNGFKRMITYVDHDNIGQLKSCERTGYRRFEEVHELKLLFFTKRKYS